MRKLQAIWKMEESEQFPIPHIRRELLRKAWTEIYKDWGEVVDVEAMEEYLDDLMETE